MSSPLVARMSFKEQMLQAREEAIIKAVGRLLAEKGFDAMTVDEVAAEVGIAKASLYKHFPGKEDLAAAAVLRAMRGVQDFLLSLPAGDAPQDKLKAVARWTMAQQLAGEVPALPSRNSPLRGALMSCKPFLDSLGEVGGRLVGWIEAAQAGGALNPTLPATTVLYTLYARACDPVLAFLQAGGRYSDAAIVELVMSTCFDGLSTR